MTAGTHVHVGHSNEIHYFLSPPNLLEDAGGWSFHYSLIFFTSLMFEKPIARMLPQENRKRL